jgi:transketolase
MQAEGIQARMVSMPSWELFDKQPQDYRNSVLTPGVPRLAVEAGVTLAWGRYVELENGDVIGIDRYGASAPYKTIYEHYGLTPERVADKAKSLI